MGGTDTSFYTVEATTVAVSARSSGAAACSLASFTRAGKEGEEFIGLQRTACGTFHLVVRVLNQLLELLPALAAYIFIYWHTRSPDYSILPRD